MKEKLLSRIAERKITVGVVGLGYVGLPLAVEKAKAGFRTIGFDVQEEKVKQVNAGHNYIGDVVDAELAQLVRNGTLSATSDFSFIKDVDFVAICVPTPLDVHQEPDISYVESSAKSIAGHLTAGTIVVLESTTYPGTTEELIKPILESGSGLKCGKDFYLGFSPERVDPGNAVYKTKNTPKVVGAVGKDAQDVIAAMYGAVLGDKVHVVSSPAVAEMTKILENTYRNINIGLINELAILCNLFRKQLRLSTWGANIRMAIATVVVFWVPVEVLGRLDFFKEIWIEPEKYTTQMICILVAFVALLVYIMFAAHKKKSHE